MFAWQTEACLSSAVTCQSLNRSLYRMLHNLLAHNSPIGMELGTVREGEARCDMENEPCSSPLMGFCASYIAMLEHTNKGAGRCMLFKGQPIKRRKLIMVRLGAERERKEARSLWALGTWACSGEMWGSHPLLSPIFLIDTALPNTTSLLKTESWNSHIPLLGRDVASVPQDYNMSWNVHRLEIM